MSKDFDLSFDFVIGAEGVYSNDPRDSGGPTKFGISQNAHPKLTTEQIKNLTVAEAKKIYFDEYWHGAQCDKIWWPYNIAVFDFAVNCGPVIARKLLQTALNVETDGVFGPITINALRDECDALERYFDLRRTYYKTRVEIMPKNKVFLKGWLNRVTNLEKYIKGTQ